MQFARASQTVRRRVGTTDSLLPQRSVAQAPSRGGARTIRNVHYSVITNQYSRIARRFSGREFVTLATYAYMKKRKIIIYILRYITLELVAVRWRTTDTVAFSVDFAVQPSAAPTAALSGDSPSFAPSKHSRQLSAVHFSPVIILLLLSDSSSGTPQSKFSTLDANFTHSWPVDFTRNRLIFIDSLII